MTLQELADKGAKRARRIGWSDNEWITLPRLPPKGLALDYSMLITRIHKLQFRISEFTESDYVEVSETQEKL